MMVYSNLLYYLCRKNNTLYKRSIPYFLFLALFFSSCAFDSEESVPVPKKEAIKSVQYYTHAQIVVVEKNWDRPLKDSLINNSGEINLSFSSYDEMIFVSQQKDSISFFLSKIHSLNPIIVFSPEKGPILTSLNQLEQLLNFYFPKIDSIIIPKEKSKEIITESIKTKPSIVYYPKRDSLTFLMSKPDHLLPVAMKSKTLTERKPIDLIDRSRYYPLLNTNQSLQIRFDNDFWDYTDYYYTNGAAIGYVHPIFAFTPMAKLLISNQTNGLDYYGFQVLQHMYTGFQPKVDTIVQGDRPWAAYSLIGQFLTSYDYDHKIVHYSAFSMGLLGPESGGGFVQNLVHTILPNNSPPKGWHNQIAHDYLIDYQYEIKKLLYQQKNLETYIQAGAQVGSLRDNLKWGFGARYGNFIPFYKDTPIYNRKRITTSFERKLRLNLVFDFNTYLIAYDATLQGGITNRTSIYVIPPGQINRFVIQSYLGVELSYGRVELQFLQYWKSKEFQTAKDHKYGSVKLNIAF
ncbi:MAG: hypothetical protein B7C24_15175 [Bacteroidetes bacterium 4572_77]|nr:MAG: hypothetical protein B7C24_15175 [Bacteroidetes bacterium 4572_77]